MTSKRTMMTAALLLALAVLSRVAAGQPQPPAQAQPQQQAQAQAPAREELLKQLDRDIWIPFSEAFAAGDAERFMSLHSKDLVRVEGGERKQVMGWAQYAEQNRRSVEARKSRGAKVAIDFRFLERIASPELASERGIFQFTMTPSTPPNAEPRRFYGKFHVVSRQENGAWKILVDYDSNEGGTIDEKSWQAAFARDDYGKY